MRCPIFRYAALASLHASLISLAAAVPRARSGQHDPIGSVQGLIRRVIGPQYISSFNLSVIPPDAVTGFDVFELSPGNAGRIDIRGSAGFALAAGLNEWLKYTANCSISWGRNGTGNQVLLPPPGNLPMPATSSRVVAPVRERYAYNVCTYGYTMAWWDFFQFEAEIDRLALWGVSLPLAFQGQEYTWDRFYRVNISSARGRQRHASLTLENMMLFTLCCRPP